MDALYDTARAAPDQASARDALMAVQDRVAESRTWLWLLRVDTKSAYSDTVQVGPIAPIHHWTTVADWRWTDAAQR